MKKLTMGLLGILTMSTTMWATVPYTFTPNTPAKASEVNENFKSLSDKLTTLENNVSSNSAAIQADGGDCDAPVFTYTYQYIPSDIGDTITVGGVDYIMVAMPFIEYGTGDHYYIKQPVKKLSYPSTDNINLNIYFSTNYVQQGVECYTETFSGFPAQGWDGIRYENSYGANITEPGTSSDALTTNARVYGSQTIKINQTNFAMFIYLTKELQNTSLSSGDVDLRDNIDWSVLDIDTSLVDDLKTLMNYVEIVKIP